MVQNQPNQGPPGARATRLLTETQVKNAKAKDKPLKLAEPGGLFLLVKPNGAKLWRGRFRLDGKEGLLSLGHYPDVGLAQARKLFREARAQVAQGINPVHYRQQIQSEKAKNTFGAIADSWQKLTSETLSKSTKSQRKREIEKHLLPKFGNMSINSITRPQLSSLLMMVEGGCAQTKNRRPAPETARNLRSHLNSMFEHAIDIGAASVNPTPPLRMLKPRKPVHHAALPEQRLGEFLRALDDSGIAAATRIAMLLVLLTACRKNEVTSAEWGEIDLASATWTIPARRMKSRQDHEVPLSRQASALILELREITPLARQHLFPNRLDTSRPMADRSLNAVIERLGYSDQATPHGMRALFSTYFNRLGSPSEVIERCLAHASKDKIRAAYNRHNYIEERRALLQQWADHLDDVRQQRK